MQSFYDYDFEGLISFMGSLGQKPFRAKQLLDRVYRQGIRSFSEVTEASADLRAKLVENLSLALPSLVERQESVDGTVKLLLSMADGEKVETVLIPDEERLTQCVSTQAGCAMGCAFCRTGIDGLTRNLSAGEIIAQLLAGEVFGGFDRLPSNVVFMGMGEPLHNFDNTFKSHRVMTSPWGLNIGRRKITISTCGLVEQLKKVPPETLGSIAISLNATTDEVRDRVMPVNRRYPLATLIETLKTLPLPARDRFTIEYVLLGGVNDTVADAKRLVRLLDGIRCKVNLIPFNSHGQSDFLAPSPVDVERFQKYLLDHDMIAVLRKSRGADILAACGQLRAKTDGGPCPPEN